MAMHVVTIASIDALPDDVLRVIGTVDGTIIEAYGSISATQRYYPPDQVGADGKPIKGAIMRAMTSAEAAQYCQQLLLARAGIVDAVPAPASIMAIPTTPLPQPDQAPIT